MKKLTHIYILEHDHICSLRSTSYPVGFATTKVEAEMWKQQQDPKNHATYKAIWRRENQAAP